MIAGVILLLLTGLCWVGIAAVVSHAAGRRLDINVIQAGAALICVATGSAVLWFQPPPVAEFRAKILIQLLIASAGVGNFLMIRLMREGMRRGNNGAVWGITQSALICPFMMGMLFFGVAPTGFRISGVLLILLAIYLFSRARSNNRTPELSWLIPTLGAFLLSGASQCFANLPSYLEFPGMTSVRRAVLAQSGVLAAFICLAPLEYRKLKRRGTLKPVLILGIVNTASLFFFFYNGLNLVTAAGCGSIGYPVAQGTSIAGFLIYSKLVLKEPLNKFSLPALLSMIAGIVVISL